MVMMESVAMSEHGADTTEQVLKFVPKEWPNSYGAQVEEVGQAVVAKIQRAADLSNENCDRAMALAHKLSMQLRAAEDRINQLEAEVELLRDRAVRAERWLQTIQKEIEEKLIAPRLANGTEPTSIPKDAADALGEGRGSEQGTAGQQHAAEQCDELASPHRHDSGAAGETVSGFHPGRSLTARRYGGTGLGLAISRMMGGE